MYRLRSIQNEYLLIAILLLLMGGMGLSSPRFLSLENFFDILRNASFIGICSIGFLVVLISGGVDISFTANATVAQYALGLLLTSSLAIPAFAILLVPILIGALLGWINAVLINRLRVSPIIVTIATLNLYYGAIQFASNGAWLYAFPEWFTGFARITVWQFVSENDVPYGLSVLTLIWFVVACAGYFLLEKTRLGRKVFAVGGSLESSRRLGIRIERVRWFVYAFLGAIAGLGAIVYTLMTRTVAPNAMMGLEFNVLSAVVLGGASISGGKGSVLGTVLGVLLIAVLTNGLTILKVPNHWHQVFIGAMLVISVTLTALRERAAKQKEALDAA